jgi:hypothetical protein
MKPDEGRDSPDPAGGIGGQCTAVTTSH